MPSPSSLITTAALAVAAAGRTGGAGPPSPAARTALVAPEVTR